MHKFRFITDRLRFKSNEELKCVNLLLKILHTLRGFRVTMSYYKLIAYRNIIYCNKISMYWIVRKVRAAKDLNLINVY